MEDKKNLSQIEQQLLGEQILSKDVELYRGRENELYFRLYSNNKLKRFGCVYNNYLYQNLHIK